jgi:hypothetical protein
MLDLFAMEVVIKDEVLISVDKKQFHKVEIKESTGVYPYQVSVESGSSGRIHGRQSYSFSNLEDAEKRFTSFVSSYREDGFKKSA